MTLLKKFWWRVHEPKFVAACHSLAYLILAAVCFYALVSPPSSIKGELGANLMTMLAVTGAVGGTLGAPSALTGAWWAEKPAAAAAILAAAVYTGITLFLHFTTGGNRLLQAGFLANVLLLYLVRWYRIKDRPYDPARPPTAETTARP